MGVFDLIGGLVSTGYQINKDQHLTGAEREANEFSQIEAGKNRDFQAAQAEIARDWQEEQYLKFNSPAAMIRQYQEAGINPALMFGEQGPAASTSTAAPAGDSATSVTPAGGGNIAQTFAQLAMLSAQIKNINADTENKSADTKYKDIQGQGILGNLDIAGKNAEKQRELWDAQIDKAIAETDSESQHFNLMSAQAMVERVRKDLLSAQATGVEAENVAKQWEAGFISDFGMSPELAGDLVKAAAGVVGSITEAILEIKRLKNLKLPTREVISSYGPKGRTVTTKTTSKVAQ